MPRSSATPCNKPACNALTHARFCSKHKQTDDRRSSNARGYDSAWRKLSERHRRAHPLCEAHKALGQLVPADLVDHIVPVHIAPDRVKDPDNLQSLCNSCHSEKTAQDLLRYGSATTHRTEALRG